MSVIPSEVSDKPKATPGPWKRGDCDSWIVWAPRYASTDWVSQGCTLGAPEAVVVAVVEATAWAMGGLDPDERDAWLAETDATADLIAAAPDLLAALKGLDEAFVSRHGCFPLDEVTPEQRLWKVAMQNARAAIDKAEGRS